MRKLNKKLRSELFHTIAMKLVRKDIEDFEQAKKVLADDIYLAVYGKDVKKMEALPADYFGTVNSMYFDESPILLVVNSVSNYFFPATSSQQAYSWNRTCSYLTLTNPRVAKGSDQGTLRVVVADLPKRMQNKLTKLNATGEALIERVDLQMNELKNLLNSCKTIKDLKKALPEFAEFYPSELKDNFPVVAADTSNLKVAIDKYKKTKAAEEVKDEGTY